MVVVAVAALEGIESELEGQAAELGGDCDVVVGQGRQERGQSRAGDRGGGE